MPPHPSHRKSRSTSRQWGRYQFIFLFASITLTLAFIYTSSAISFATPSSNLIPEIPPPDLTNPTAVEWVSSHVIFFLHVPKTAGTTFSYLLHYLVQPYVAVFHPGDDRLLQHPSLRLDLTFHARPKMETLSHPSNRKQFAQHYVDTFSMQGHVDVLIADAFAYGNRSLEFITMVRDPIQRALSHYCYILDPHQVPPNQPPTVQYMVEQTRNIYPTWVDYVLSTNDSMSAKSFVNYMQMAVKDGYDNWHTRAFAGCLHTPVRLRENNPTW